ncbi:MAG: hypothetical protein OEY49_11975 [Candidatus Heimdallarchaeota archaeon]|nr:hypothetical protein [Candidatus Heimdallarchaeota archaeon]
MNFSIRNVTQSYILLFIFISLIFLGNHLEVHQHNTGMSEFKVINNESNSLEFNEITTICPPTSELSNGINNHTSEDSPYCGEEIDVIQGESLSLHWNFSCTLSCNSNKKYQIIENGTSIFTGGYSADANNLIIYDVNTTYTGYTKYEVIFYLGSIAPASIIANDTVFVSVFQENIPPNIISRPSNGNLEIIYGSINNWLNWTATDIYATSYFPGTFRYIINEEVINSGVWVSNEQLNFTIDGDIHGRIVVTLELIDYNGNSLNDTIEVFVIDIEAPVLNPTIYPESYTLGSLGNKILWNFTDDFPDFYNVTLNGELYESGDWESNEYIIVDIDGLSLGTNVFMINVFDRDQNRRQQTITINVIAGITHTSVPIVNSIPEYSFIGDTIFVSFTWLLHDNITVITAGTYTISARFNDDIINTYVGITNSQGKLNQSIFINYLHPGNYNFELNLTKNNFESQTYTFIIPIYRHNISMTINIPEDLIQREQYAISIQLHNHDVIPNGTSLQLNAVTADPILQGINITLKMQILFENQTVETLVFSDLTDASGYLEFVVSAEITQYIISVQSIEVEAYAEYLNITTLSVEEITLPRVIEYDLLANVLPYLIIIGIAILAIIIISIIMMLIPTFSLPFLNFLENNFFAFGSSKNKQIIEGIMSIKKIILVNEPGLPIYEKSFVNMGLETSLLSGFSTAISSFLEEIEDETIFGFNKMERQGLSILSHKLKYITIIFISTISLNEDIQNTIFSVHKALEEKIPKDLDYIDGLSTDDQINMLNFFQSHGLYTQLLTQFYLDKTEFKKLLRDNKVSLYGRVRVSSLRKIFKFSEDTTYSFANLKQIFKEYGISDRSAANLIVMLAKHKVLVNTNADHNELYE